MRVVSQEYSTLGRIASWSCAPAATSIDASLAPPVPSASACAPPFAIVPDAISPGELPPATEIDHAIPSPQTSWPSVILPMTLILPTMGLFHVTAMPALGDGCMFTLLGGKTSDASSEIGSLLLLMMTIGASAFALFLQP